MTDWHAHMRTACGKPPVAFYEKVLVLDSAEDPEIRGRYGWVLGVSADDEAGLILDYQVHFDEFETGYGVRPEDMEGTGEIAPRSKFYDDGVPPIRVRVDEQGRGHIVE